MEKGKVEVTSFSYLKNPLPDDTWHVVDCRALPNPWKDPGLRTCQGDSPFLLGWLMAKAPDTVSALINEAQGAVEAGKVKIAFGCDHGKHRSVCMATYFWHTLSK